MFFILKKKVLKKVEQEQESIIERIDYEISEFIKVLLFFLTRSFDKRKKNIIFSQREKGLNMIERK